MIQPMGEVMLPLSLGSLPKRSTKLVKFLVVKAPSAYNVILGRPSLNLFRAIASTYHLKLKFPTPDGVGEAIGDERVARECYMNTLKRSREKTDEATDEKMKKKMTDGRQGTTNPPEEYVGAPCGEKKVEAVEELKVIHLSVDGEKTVKIGTEMCRPTEESLTRFLVENEEVFAWSMTDFYGIPPNVITHQLNVNPEAKPVKQKKRIFGLERSQAIQTEVDKLLEAKHIRPVQYPEWLANVVLVPKPNGKWCLCIDFTNLNKACPKDPFPLPRIDLLVDSTSGCEMLSFLDAYQGYNQISLAPEDQEKTSFVTDQGIFCYNVMPFGLKNAGATYQRLVNDMFKNQIGRNMEVYIDDMLVKSVKEQDHVKDLKECFQILRAFGMKLNPAKCTFGVQGGKFLGYMISERGIEANPEKISAIMNMRPPKSIKEVQKLAGKLASLNRFISRSADKGLHFFKILRGAAKFEWDKSSQEAFEALKRYLSSPPLLTKPRTGETLYLYLAISENAVSSVLVRQENREHHPMYYVSRMLQGAESRYSQIEKLALSLITAARKLRPYFQSHQVVVLTNHPLKQVLASPEVSERMVKWAVELSEFGVEFQPRPAIKAQTLADFIVELAYDEAGISTPSWSLHVDGSSTLTGSGAGIVLESPEGDKFEYAIKLEYPSSNNEAEYEALLAGGELALAAGARKIVIYSDSQLVVNQIQGLFETRDEKMAKYSQKAKNLLEKFEEASVIQVSRTENSVADQLAKLASSMAAIRNRKITFLSSERAAVEEKEEVMCADPTPLSWKGEIVDFLTKGAVPENQKEAKALRGKPSRFVMMDGELYKRGFSQPLLKCLTPEEGNYVLREIHEGICGNHLGGKALAGKALRQGFFWPTMLSDAHELVRRCRACQEHGNIYHQPAAPMRPLESPCPFDQWGMDLVGPFPQAAGQRKFLIVAVDYFTKWVEAELLAKISKKEVIKFLWKNIICRFGIPRSIISDNETQFSGNKLKDWCKGLGIKQFFTSVSNPQANGQTEVTNRTILQHLKTRLGNAKGAWVDELPSVLWAYRTTPRNPTGESPFNLTYGTDAVVPAKVGELSWRVKYYNPNCNEQGLRMNLDFVEEVREKAAVRAAMYKTTIH
ncbi:UNVERIFIED_CONTAM: Retrovirus-related Pol polyprotein from transposon [Sesamum indicum]